MPFQKQVNILPAAGFVGGRASGNAGCAVGVLAGEDIAAGRFVAVVGGAGAGGEYDPPRAYAGGADAVGFAGRNRAGVILDPEAEASVVVGKNQPLEVVLAGDLFIRVENPEDAEYGMKLFYRVDESADGAGDRGVVRAAPAGAVVEGFLETGWTATGIADAATGIVKASSFR